MFAFNSLHSKIALATILALCPQLARFAVAVITDILNLCLANVIQSS
jgi:hypothetical protein